MRGTTRVGGVLRDDVQPARWSASMLSAVIASVIGGTIMAAVMALVYAFAYSKPLLYPLQVIGSYRYGDNALIAMPPIAYLWALAFHFGVCILWGVAYGILATAMRVDKAVWAPIALGVAIGLASQLVDINLVTPALMQHLHGHNLWMENVPAWLSWVGHVAFGLSFAFFVPIFRSLWLRFVHRSDLLWNDPRIR